ncbi:MAG: prephenate dehydrogenase/arogenate dehydrogenase family protein [Candidatus Omnitrophota bacterium]
MKLKKAVIIGMGLIGGSIGKALLKRGLAEEVVGVCRRQISLDRAIKEGALSRGYVDSYKEAVKGADIIFIATPVHVVKEAIEKLSEIIKDPGMLVTDVGSTKKEIVDHAAGFSGSFSFIGAHPLAGSERSGVEYSDPDLFEGSVCILTPGERSSEENEHKLRALWEAMGATVDILTPGEHDKNLAFSSHLPHIVAYALSGSVGKDIPRSMFAAGFKDTTRIASSDPALWSDIFLSNRENVLEAIKSFNRALSAITDDIRESREEDLRTKLSDCKKGRDEII